MPAPTGVWIAYTGYSEEPIVLAVFSNELNASRFALDTTDAANIVRVTQVPFGVTITDALAASEAAKSKGRAVTALGAAVKDVVEPVVPFTPPSPPRHSPKPSKPAAQARK